MAIQIPSNFESVEAKIDWLREQISLLIQDHANPAIEEDRQRLASALNAALADAGVDTNPENIDKPYIPEVFTTPTE